MDKKDEAMLRSLYPSMYQDEVKAEKEKVCSGIKLDEHDFALRQLYPSMYRGEWMAAFYEREKDRWD